MVILIDNGHGIEVLGKHSPKLNDIDFYVPCKFTENDRFREWKYNRVIANEIVTKMKAMGYDARLLVEEDKDTSLTERVKRINKVCDEYGAGNVMVISVHANAAGDGSKWMGGQGWEAYTTVGTTNSDKLAEFLYKRAEDNLNGRTIRRDTSDGDSDKEANFYIIKGAKCVAVLTENFFFDNKSDLKYMTSEEGVHNVVRLHIEGIIDYIESKKK